MKRPCPRLLYFLLFIGCFGTACSISKHSMLGYCDTRPQAGNKILLNQIEPLGLYEGQQLSYRIKELLLKENLIMEYAPEQEYYLLQHGITKIDTAHYKALLREMDFPYLLSVQVIVPPDISGKHISYSKEEKLNPYTEIDYAVLDKQAAVEITLIDLDQAKQVYKLHTATTIRSFFFDDDDEDTHLVNPFSNRSAMMVALRKATRKMLKDCDCKN